MLDVHYSLWRYLDLSKFKGGNVYLIAKMAWVLDVQTCTQSSNSSGARTSARGDPAAAVRVCSCGGLCRPVNLAVPSILSTSSSSSRAGGGAARPQRHSRPREPPSQVFTLSLSRTDISRGAQGRFLKYKRKGIDLLQNSTMLNQVSRQPPFHNFIRKTEPHNLITFFHASLFLWKTCSHWMPLTPFFAKLEEFQMQRDPISIPFVWQGLSELH